MGIATALTSVIASVLPDAIAGIAPELAGGLLGAGGGALLGGVTGGNVGLDALTGGITGGLIPAGGSLLGPFLGTTGGDVLGGAAGGLIGSGITGGNPIEGGLLGAASGGAAGLLSGLNGAQGATTTTGAGLGGGGASLSSFNTPDSLAASLSGGATGFSGDAASALSSAGGGLSPDLAAATLSGGATGFSATPLSAANIAGGAGAPFSLTNPSTWGNLLGGGTASGAAGGAAGANSGGLTGLLQQHPILTLGGGLLASQALSPLLSGITGGGLTSQEKNLLNAEQPALSAANSLIGSEVSGTLPPGAYASINQALQADIANIRSRYAQSGQSGSAAEAQDIANAQQQAAANQFGLAQQATQTGLSALGLNQNVYNTLVQDQLNQQENLQKAFAGLFQSLGTGTALGSLLKAA